MCVYAHTHIWRSGTVKRSVFSSTTCVSVPSFSAMRQSCDVIQDVHRSLLIAQADFDFRVFLLLQPPQRQNYSTGQDTLLLFPFI